MDQELSQNLALAAHVCSVIVLAGRRQKEIDLFFTPASTKSQPGGTKMTPPVAAQNPVSDVASDIGRQHPNKKPPKATPKKHLQPSKRDLLHAYMTATAGNPYGWSASDFLGVKAAIAIALAASMFFLFTLGGKAIYAVPAGGVLGLIGFFIPDLLVRSKTGQRRTQILRALPDALDLLVISVEAGLGFDSAIQRLVEKKEDALATEFAPQSVAFRVVAYH